MRNLAVSRPEGTDERRALDYLPLADAIVYALTHDAEKALHRAVVAAYAKTSLHLQCGDCTASSSAPPMPAVTHLELKSRSIVVSSGGFGVALTSW